MESGLAYMDGTSLLRREAERLGVVQLKKSRLWEDLIAAF